MPLSEGDWVELSSRFDEFASAEEVTLGKVHPLMMPAAASFVTRLPKLQRVVASEADDNVLVGVVVKLPKLTSLILDWGDQVTDAGVQEITSKLPRLSTLHLNRCKRVTNIGAQAVTLYRAARTLTGTLAASSGRIT